MGIMNKFLAVLFFAVAAHAAPSADADADADAQFLGYHAAPLAAAPLAAAPLAATAPVAPIAYHAGPAPNCVTEQEILVTQTCTPTAENVCTTQTVETEEIEYEKVCKEVVDVICDGPAHYIAKREADAEADPQFLAAPYHHA